jgi:hypothetical protein
MDLPGALAWYSDLASTQGWKEYVWHRVNQMAKESPRVYGELPRLLTEAMEKKLIEEKLK